MDQNFINDPIWKQLQEYFSSDSKRKSEILEQLKGYANLSARTISYDPPAGSIPIIFEEK
jgi:hypothetical protein